MSQLTPAEFGELLAPIMPQLRKYALKLTRDRDRAADLVNDTIVRALRKLDHFEAGTGLREWLFVILHNENVNQVRRRIRRPEDQLIGQEERVAPDDPEVGLMVADVRRLLDRLPPDLKRAIVLVGFRGLGYEAAARIEHVPVGTIRSRLFRGRELLKLLFNGVEVDREDLDLIAWARGER